MERSEKLYKPIATEVWAKKEWSDERHDVGDKEDLFEIFELI